jgi:plasmid maintenance system killer protein
MDSFLSMDVQRAAIQSMESLYILATSKNISTIKGRYDFLLTVIPKLKSARNNSQYSTFIKGALDQFRTMYPTGEPQDFQLAVISNPETFDINEFYCNSLTNGITNYCQKQIEEIKNLKRESSKTKRVAKVLETIKSAENELQLKCLSSKSYTKAIGEVKTLFSDISEMS